MVPLISVMWVAVLPVISWEHHASRCWNCGSMRCCRPDFLTARAGSLEIGSIGTACYWATANCAVRIERVYDRALLRWFIHNYKMQCVPHVMPIFYALFLVFIERKCVPIDQGLAFWIHLPSHCFYGCRSVKKMLLGLRYLCKVKSYFWVFLLTNYGSNHTIQRVGLCL